MRRRHAIAAISAWAGNLAVPAVIRSQPLQTLRVASTLDDSVTPLLYGLSSGIFKELGLDVQLQGSTSGAAQSSAIAAGAIDIGKTSPLALIAAHVRGISFKLVAGSALYNAAEPISGLIVAADSPIKSGADLDGKTAATPALRDLDQIATQAWVDQHGGDSSTMRFVELPNQAVAAALLAGRIDAATIVVPTLADALATGRIRLLGRSFDAIARRFLIAVWFCSPAFAQRSPDLVARFAEGMRRAADYTNGHHAQTVDLLADYSHMSPGVIAKMTRTQTSTVLDARDLQPTIDAAAKYKVIDRPFPASELLSV